MRSTNKSSDKKGKRRKPGLLAESDPWQSIEERYPIDSEVTGIVVSVMDFGAFVRLEPGVDGLVHISEIISTSPERVEDVLWVGDRVKAIVLACKPEQRELSLSIKGYVERAESVRQRAWLENLRADADRATPTIAELIGDKSDLLMRKWGPHAPARSVRQFKPPVSGEQIPIHRVLVVDNDESDLRLLHDLLRELGHDRIDTARTGEEAVRLAIARRPDLIFLDMVLPGIHGTSVRQRILEEIPDASVVFTTGIADLEEALDIDASELGGAGMLVKPIDLAELSATVVHIGQRKAGKRADLPQTIQSKVSAIEQSSPQERSSETLEAALTRLLEQVKKATRATSCAVFHMDSVTHEVSVITHCGTAFKDYEKAKYSLRYSPVKDVIIDSEEIFENEVAKRRGKYTYLLNLVSFSSCIGLPIPALGSPGPSPYGLFLFADRAGRFTYAHLQQALLTCKAMAMAIERKQLEQSISRAQRQILLGRLASLTIHEINNKLGTIESQVKLLQTRLTEEAESGGSSRAADPLKEGVRAIAEASKSIRQFMKLYLSFTRNERRESVNVNSLLRRVIQLVTPLAQTGEIAIRTKLAPNMPAIQSVGVSLEQVFLNLVLNAVQQMSKQTPDSEIGAEGGELVIRTSYEPAIDDLPIKIRIVDSGPGIHGKYLQRLFSFGFSTRQEGTGLGLFISRMLIESLGGRISVEETAVPVGTTFLVELPTNSAEECSR